MLDFQSFHISALQFRLCICERSLFGLSKIQKYALETRGRLCNVFVSSLIKRVFVSESLHYSQGCALANLRLVFFADDFLEFEASGWDADFLYIRGAFFGEEFEGRSAVLRWSQRHFTSFWLWDHGNSAFSGARKSLGARESCTQIYRLQAWMRRFGCLLGPFGRLCVPWGRASLGRLSGGSWESLGRLSGGSWEVLGGETKQENSSETTIFFSSPFSSSPIYLNK